MRPILLACFLGSSIPAGSTYPSRSAMTSSVSTSASDPRETETKCRYSALLYRALPSAMFAGIDTAARRSWIVNPNRSSLGNVAVTAWISTTKSTASCQTSRSRKLEMARLEEARGLGLRTYAPHVMPPSGAAPIPYSPVPSPHLTEPLHPPTAVRPCLRSSTRRATRTSCRFRARSSPSTPSRQRP